MLASAINSAQPQTGQNNIDQGSAGPRELINNSTTSQGTTTINLGAIGPDGVNTTNTEAFLNKMHDPNVNASLGSSEGVQEELPNKENTTAPGNQDLYKTVRDLVPQVGLSLASFLHGLGALNRIKDFLPKAFGDFIDQHAQKISKATNIFNYVVTAFDAFKNNRSVDGLARAAYPAVIPFVSLENMYMASGFSSGTTMIEKALQPKTKEMKGNEDFLGNIKNNLIAFQEQWNELSKDGLWSALTKIYTPWKNSESLMFVGANCNILGALLGLTLGLVFKPARLLASLIRNKGSMSTDIAKFFSGDPNFAIAGGFYIGVSVLDLIKDYFPEGTRRTLSHISVAINNAANYYYLKASKVRSDVKPAKAEPQTLRQTSYQGSKLAAA